MRSRIKKGIQTVANSLGYRITRVKENKVESNSQDFTPYVENKETGAINMEEKLKRLKNGEPFEWPNMVALNQTVVSMLDDREKRILEIGSGTGCFASFAAQDKKKHIVASELDKESLEWAKENRSADNIEYVSKWIYEFEDQNFDLVVSVDVIEHVKDYGAFLYDISKVSNKAIITTPNKNRSEASAKASPPNYIHHVREWTAGEFYWVLKMFYKNVKLYAMPDVYTPKCVSISILSRMTPLIAVCLDSFNYKTK